MNYVHDARTTSNQTFMIILKTREKGALDMLSRDHSDVLWVIKKVPLDGKDV